MPGKRRAQKPLCAVIFFALALAAFAQTESGPDALQGWFMYEDFACFAENGEVTLEENLDREAADVVIPETINGMPVTEYAVPATVVTIANGAFAHCTGLLSITLHPGVTGIGSDAFFRCTGITSFVLPPEIDAISAGTFNRCGGMVSVVIPESVTKIGSGAFSAAAVLFQSICPRAWNVSGKAPLRFAARYALSSYPTGLPG